MRLHLASAQTLGIDDLLYDPRHLGLGRDDLMHMDLHLCQALELTYALGLNVFDLFRERVGVGKAVQRAEVDGRARAREAEAR